MGGLPVDLELVEVDRQQDGGLQHGLLNLQPGLDGLANFLQRRGGLVLLQQVGGLLLELLSPGQGLLNVAEGLDRELAGVGGGEVDLLQGDVVLEAVVELGLGDGLAVDGDLDDHTRGRAVLVALGQVLPSGGEELAQRGGGDLRGLLIEIDGHRGMIRHGVVRRGPRVGGSCCAIPDQAARARGGG